MTPAWSPQPAAPRPSGPSTSGKVGWALLVGGLIVVAVALVMMFTGGGGDGSGPAGPVGLAALAVGARRRRGAPIVTALVSTMVLALGPVAPAQEGFVCPGTLDGVPLVQETPPTENEAFPGSFSAACDYQFNDPEGDALDRGIHMEAFWTTVDPGLSGFGTAGGGGCATRNGTSPVVHQTPEPGITTQQYYFNSLDRYAYVWVLSDRDNLADIQDAASDMLFLVAEPQAAVCADATGPATAGPTDERPPPTEEAGPRDPENPDLDRISTLEWVLLIFGVGAVYMGGSLVIRDRKRRRGA